MASARSMISMSRSCRSERQRALVGLEQHIRQDRNCVPALDDTLDMGERPQEGAAFNAQLHQIRTIGLKSGPPEEKGPGAYLALGRGPPGGGQRQANPRAESIAGAAPRDSPFTGLQGCPQGPFRWQFRRAFARQKIWVRLAQEKATAAPIVKAGLSAFDHALEEVDFVGKGNIVLPHFADLAHAVEDRRVVPSAEAAPDFGQRGGWSAPWRGYMAICLGRTIWRSRRVGTGGSRIGTP